VEKIGHFYNVNIAAFPDPEKCRGGYSIMDLARPLALVDSCAELESGSDKTIVARSYFEVPNTGSY
jgi:hypothetical protein